METIEIKKDAALKAHANANTRGKKLLADLFGEKVFKKDVMECIKLFIDVLEDQGIDEEDFVKSCTGLSKDEIAYRKVKLLTQSLNEGWKPDWENSNERKYYPWFTMGSPSGGGFSCHDFGAWVSYSTAGSRLCFKSSELAEYAGTQFTEIYRDFMLIN